jgi:hypothetical protein
VLFFFLRCFPLDDLLVFVAFELGVGPGGSAFPESTAASSGDEAAGAGVGSGAGGGVEAATEGSWVEGAAGWIEGSAGVVETVAESFVASLHPLGVKSSALSAGLCE